MNKINLKSKKGFTLIELLVVIGILAVLAAIAIPSVAGLIDRANVSADNTNANEMTNAIERFASEYELYIQDIGSGALDPNDLDSAQGRVYNVTGATTRGDITAIEKAQSVKVADVGDEVAIYRDTKYPVNNATLQKIVENYMKTSSSTFEPKQSDCNYYYSPDCGLVVCTETDKSETADLNALVVSGKDAKGKELGAQTQWINITEGTSTSTTQSIGSVTMNDGTVLTWEEAKQTFGVTDTTIPNQAFWFTDIKEVVIPDGITEIGDAAFADCDYLISVSIPNSVQTIGDAAFSASEQIVKIVIPDSVTHLSDFLFELLEETEIHIPASINSIGAGPLNGCRGKIVYGGTISQWTAFSNGIYCEGFGDSYPIICSDGTYMQIDD